MVLLSEDYYIDEKTGYVVFTEVFHRKRGFCCGNKCKHCAYEPMYIKGNRELRKTK